MKRLSALRIDAGLAYEARQPLNSVSISYADPITPMVALLKGLPFSMLRVYPLNPRKNEANPRVSADILQRYRAYR